jgi:hypothetical protein
VDFHQRMKLFRELVDSERISIQGSDDVNLGQRSRGVVVRIRKQRILADGMDALGNQESFQIETTQPSSLSLSLLRSSGKLYQGSDRGPLCE